MKPRLFTPCSPSRLHARAGGAPAAAALSLESLEPRVLLAAYAYQPLAETMNFPPDILQDVAPPEGVMAASFGHAAAGLGDIDGDGFGDFAISAPGTPATETDPAIPGRVFLYSGATGELIRTLDDGFADFGAAIANIGDIDGDGAADLLVGSPLNDSDALDAIAGSGGAFVFSGADGAVLRFFAGQTPGGEYGRAVAPLGDVNGDTLPEVLIGAPSSGPEGQGQVFVVTTAASLIGFPGDEIIHTLTGDAAGDRFGSAVISTGDLLVADSEFGPGDPGDGVPDILVGAPLNDAGGENAGLAYLYSGATGTLRETLSGTQAGARFGTALGASVLNGSSVLLVGAPDHDIGPDAGITSFLPDSGRVFRFNAFGQLNEPGGALWGLEGTHFGETITPVGDVNGDGRGDFAFGLPGATEGQRIIINFVTGASGVGGTALVSLEIPEGLRDRVFAIGDIDGDGAADVLGTAPGAEHAVAASSLTLLPPSIIYGGSGDLSFLFASSLGNSIGNRADYAFINGVYTRQADIPGVGLGVVIKFVNNAHTIVGRVAAADSSGFLIEGTPFITVGGVRTLLPDAVTEIAGEGAPAEPDWERFAPVDLNEDGSIIFNETIAFDAPTGETNFRAWLFKDGVLTFLWNGITHDLGDDGSVLGFRREAGSPTTDSFRVRSPEGEVTIITGLASAGRFDSAGAVVGGTLAGQLARWRPEAGGTVAILAELPPLFGGYSPYWRIIDATPDGRVLAELNYSVVRGVRREEYLFTPEDGLKRLDRFAYGVTSHGAVASGALRFGDEGEILTNLAILQPIDEQVAWTLREGSPIGGVTGAVAGINILGDPVLLYQSGDTWHGLRMDMTSIVPNTEVVITDVQLAREPLSGRLHAFIIANGNTHTGAFSEQSELLNLFLLNNGPVSTAITGNATVFATADGRLVYAGTDPNGDLVVYFQGMINPGFAVPWIYDNLTTTHLAARGQDFTPVASTLTGFATPWGTDHLAYLDAEGEVHVVWWGPDAPLWRTDQLTTVASSGALSGTLTNLVTPWESLHINAFNADGEAVAVWWAPEFGGNWRTDRLAPNSTTGPALLDPATVTAYRAPWNALTIAGLDAATGAPTVYWWAPETDEWRAEQLELTGVPEGFTPTSPLRGGISAQGEQSLFTTDETGEVARLFWTVTNPIWTYENVTSIAAS